MDVINDHVICSSCARAHCPTATLQPHVQHVWTAPMWTLGSLAAARCPPGVRVSGPQVTWTGTRPQPSASLALIGRLRPSLASTTLLFSLALAAPPLLLDAEVPRLACVCLRDQWFRGGSISGSARSLARSPSLCWRAGAQLSPSEARPLKTSVERRRRAAHSAPALSSVVLRTRRLVGPPLRSGLGRSRTCTESPATRFPRPWGRLRSTRRMAAWLQRL